MKDLIKKLNKTIKKERALSVQKEIVQTGVFWNSGLKTSIQKNEELLRIKQKQQKNLSKRFNILESLDLEIIKAKQDTSTKQREINL
mgnify:CR=1 FL=1